MGQAAVTIDGNQIKGPGLDLRAARIERTVLISVNGELNARNSRLLELLGVEALAEDAVDRLVIDCLAVAHVGSHGLAALIELDRVASENSAFMRITRPNRVIRLLLDLAGLTRMVAAPLSERTDPQSQRVG